MEEIQHELRRLARPCPVFSLDWVSKERQSKTRTRSEIFTTGWPLGISSSTLIELLLIDLSLQMKNRLCNHLQHSTSIFRNPHISAWFCRISLLLEDIGLYFAWMIDDFFRCELDNGWRLVLLNRGFPFSYDFFLALALYPFLLEGTSLIMHREGKSNGCCCISAAIFASLHSAL